MNSSNSKPAQKGDGIKPANYTAGIRMAGVRNLVIGPGTVYLKDILDEMKVTGANRVQIASNTIIIGRAS